jgi:hypothetical protein
MPLLYTVGKFIISDWGDKADSGIGLTYRPVSLFIAWRADTTTNAGVALSPQSRTMNLAKLLFSFLYIAYELGCIRPKLKWIIKLITDMAILLVQLVH